MQMKEIEATKNTFFFGFIKWSSINKFNIGPTMFMLDFIF